MANTNQMGGANNKHHVPLGIFLFTLLGLALLYPYNTIISSADWFDYILPDMANTAGTLSNANFVASLITTFFILAFASPKEVKEDAGEDPAIRRKSSFYEAFTKNAQTSLGTLNFRIYLGFFLEGMPLLVFAIIYPSELQAIILSSIVGIGDSLAQSGIFPLAGGIHPRCTAAASLGSAIAGLIAGLLRLATKAIFPDTDEGMRVSSSVYFGIATLVIVVCGIALYAITKMKQELVLAFFQRDYAESCKSVVLQGEGIQKMIQRELELELANGEEEAKEEELQAEEADQALEEFNENELATETSDEPKKKCHPFAVFIDVTTVYREAFRCSWVPNLIQFINFFITLSLFPGLTLSMTSDSLGSWYPVILVTVFNLGDTLGRLVQLNSIVSNWIVTPVGADIIHPKTGDHLGNQRPRMKYSIGIPCILRFAFYPLIIFCVNPLYISSDVAQIIIVFLFAMSSGWVYSCCFMLTPELCRELKHKEAASLLIIVSTLLSLGIASSVGLGITSAVVAGL